MKTVFVNGCFDLFHPGHMHFLKAAAALGGLIEIGLNSDKSLLKLKGVVHRPWQVRGDLLANVAGVSWVRHLDGPDACKLIKEVRPDIYCTGAEYLGKSPEAKLCLERGIPVFYIERLGDYSTTNEAKRGVV